MSLKTCIPWLYLWNVTAVTLVRYLTPLCRGICSRTSERDGSTTFDLHVFPLWCGKVFRFLSNTHSNIFPRECYRSPVASLRHPTVTFFPPYSRSWFRRKRSKWQSGRRRRWPRRQQQQHKHQQRHLALSRRPLTRNKNTGNCFFVELAKLRVLGLCFDPH